MTVKSRTTPGTVALLGSGEYLDVMNDVDAYLLATLGDPQGLRVALLPTASGLEADGPTYWNNLGMTHFEKLGVRDIRATAIIDQRSANDVTQVALLQDVDLYYFSGGNPQHTIETLRDSKAWRVIKSAYEQGAVLAGCSAGAMMLSGHTISIRQVMQGQKVDFIVALGIVPQLIVFPHFDRMAGFLDQSRFQQILRSVPPQHTIVGIDEDTALVRVENSTNKAPAKWRVMGRQTVTVFNSDTERQVLRSGEQITL